MCFRVCVWVVVILGVGGYRPLAAQEVPAARQWVVVAPAALGPALKPLIERRRQQGYQVAIIDALDAQQRSSPQLIQQRLADVCQAFDGTSCVLIVGGWDSTHSPVHVTPTCGQHGRMAGQPTDYYYGRPDKLGAGTVAVGRFPAESLEQIAEMVRKTLDFENVPYGAWTNRIDLMVGNPGGDSELERRFAEVVVQTAADKRLSQLNPIWRTQPLVDLPGLAGSVPPQEFGERMLRQLSAGQLFACYCGHSSAAGIWSTAGHIAPREEWARVKIENSQGVLLSCGCFGCQLGDRDERGYALEAFLNPSGPVAVIGSFGESYAAAGQLALDGLMNRLAGDDPPQLLGDYYLAVQAGIARGPMDAITFWLYDQADGSRGKVPLSEQRREHLEMWTMLGDPALKLPLLRSTIDLDVQGEAKPGGKLRITAPLAASDPALAVVTVESRRLDRGQPAPKTVGKTSEGATTRQASSILLERQAQVRDGRVQCELELPQDLTDSSLIVRLIIRHNGRVFMGTRRLAVAQPEAAEGG